MLAEMVCANCHAVLGTTADGAWRSLVARSLWEREVAGSNPAAPTDVSAAVLLTWLFARQRPAEPGRPAAAGVLWEHADSSRAPR